MFLPLIALLIVSAANAQNGLLSIDVSQIEHAMSPILFGIFFEEINHAGVGGIYAEQIQNRAFEAIKDNENSTGLISLLAYGSSDTPFFVRHCDYLGYISHISSSIDQQDSSFRKIDGGLIGVQGYVSFESLDFPGYYIRHRNFRIHLEENDGSQLFAHDTSFLPSASPVDSNFYTLESYNYPNHYIFWNASDDTACMQPKFDLFLGPLDEFTNASFSITTSNYNVLTPWSVVAANGAEAGIQITTENPLNSFNNQSLVLTVGNNPSGFAGFSNPGYWGIRVQDGDTFYLSFYSRSNESAFSGTFLAYLESSDGSRVYAKTSIPVDSLSGWTKFEATLQAVVPQGEDSSAVFVLGTEAESAVLYFDIVSLFPRDTYNLRPNGLRPDLMNLVADLAPSFVRFPGGCYVEGDKLADAFRWKKSIGPIEVRPGHYDLWGYWSEDGLGYFEYLQMCEDINSEPLYVINIGISHTDYIPLENLQPWIQDALDAIEFANGPATSTWGSVRAKLYNRTEPFNLKFMALGNEDGGFSYYTSHYNAFSNAIRAVYPDIKLIANSDLTGLQNVDYYDYHVYQSPEWFLNNVHVFDNANRNGPQVFTSEYAVTQDEEQGNLRAAVAEAAWMTGLIRNSDIVGMASYAPLFVNVHDRFWNPDAIQYNSSVIAVTPSYYVQEMFSQDRGDQLISSTWQSYRGNITWTEAIATFDSETNSLIIIVVNYVEESRTVLCQIDGVSSVSPVADVITLTSQSADDQNTLDDPYNVVPVRSSINNFSAAYVFTASPHSVNKIIAQVTV